MEKLCIHCSEECKYKNGIYCTAFICLRDNPNSKDPAVESLLNIFNGSSIFDGAGGMKI